MVQRHGHSELQSQPGDGAENRSCDREVGEEMPAHITPSITVDVAILTGPKLGGAKHVRPD